MVKEIDLLEVKDIRDKHMDRVDILEKVKHLLLLPNTEFATVGQVAEYYEVGTEAIDTIIARHGNELIGCGYGLFRQTDIKEMLDKDIVSNNSVVGKSILELKSGIFLEIPNRGLRLFSEKAVLKVAFLLTESETAHQVRKELLKSNPSEYYKLSNTILIRAKKYEQDMEYFLKALFGAEFVKSQVRCGGYLLDFVVHNIIHIEVDENGHSGYDEEYEEARERHILNNTDYYTFRFNPHKDSRFEMVMNIVELFNNIGYPEEISFENNIA